MKQIETRNGSRLVISTSNGEGYGWSSRLYVNNGETATHITAKHSSERGARKWAEKKLQEMAA